MSTKFVFIGLDGSFKTTVATALHQYLDIPYLKFSQSKDVDEVYDVVADLAYDENFADAVIDRIKTIDHLVYESVIGGVDFSPTEYNRILNVHGAFESGCDNVYYIFMYGRPDVLWERLNKRADEDYVKRLHVLDDLMYRYRSVFEIFRGRNLVSADNTLEIDTTDITSDQALELVKERFEL